MPETRPDIIEWKCPYGGKHSDVVRYYADQAQAGGMLVEIGVLMGESGVMMAREDCTSVFIDTFDGRGSGHEKRYAEDKAYFISEAYKRLWEPSQNRVIMAAHSDLAVFFFPDSSIDYLFIDSDHRYSQISRDLEIWWPKIKNGGRLSGHDFNGAGWDERYINHDFEDNKHHGISKALAERFQTIEWHRESSVWSIIK